MTDAIELSEREREILRLVATGASNKEIAHTLVISPNTVKVHLRNIFAKVGVASRTEATLYALREGIITAPTASVVSIAPGVPAAAPVTVQHEASAPIIEEEQEHISLHEELPYTAPPAPARRLNPWLAAAAMLMALLLGLTAIAFLSRRQPVPQAAASLGTAALPARWAADLSLPEPLHDLAGAAYDDQIYLFGGETAQGISAKTWRLANGKWDLRADKPTPVTQAQAALLGEKIYVPGGRIAEGVNTDVLEVYDPRQDRWESAAALPQKLAGYGLAALEGRLYLFGGYDGSRARVEVYVYDPAADRWEARSPMTSARAFTGVVVTGGKIMVAGGWDGSRALDTVEMYFPPRDRAGENPWETRPGLPQPRYAMGAAGMADLVYLVGGSQDGALPPVQYLPQTNVWRTFEQPPQPCGTGLVLIPLETHLHALGCGGNDGQASAHQAYQAIYTIAFPVIQK